MAYMSQDHKKEIHALLKPIIPKSWKWSLSVNGKSSLVLTIRSAPIDLVRHCLENWNEYNRNREDRQIKSTDKWDVNYLNLSSEFSGELLELFKKIVEAMNLRNFNNSDSQTDYFHVGHYIDINIGTWDKPFIVKE